MQHFNSIMVRPSSTWLLLSRQLNSAQQRIAQLCVLECVVETATLPLRDAATKKSGAEAPLSL